MFFFPLSALCKASHKADSDIIVDLIERIGHPQSEVRYFFYETGMEFDATRRHLTYLENTEINFQKLPL